MPLFFALRPSDVALRNLCGFAAGLELSAGSLRVPPENCHVTLAFVGDVAIEDVASIRKIGTENAMSCGVVSLDTCEFWSTSRVLVATGEVSSGLSILAGRLQTAVAAHRADHPTEPQWRPHVTLARKVLQPPVLQAMSPISWTADSFVLMSSQRLEGRSVYTVVDTYPLLDKN